MTVTATYKALCAGLTSVGRECHFSPRRGLFVRAVDGAHYHDLWLMEYPTHSRDLATVPRLEINKYRPLESIPPKVAKLWQVDGGRSGMFPSVELKLGFLPEELDRFSESLPGVIACLEKGQESGFEKVLPYESHMITPQSIWSKEAYALVVLQNSAGR